MRWLIAAALLVSSSPLHAQGWIDPVRPIRDFGVHKLRTAVTVKVTGRVAAVEVEEWFRNDGPALGEGDYLYPLPGEAVFSNFSLFQGDRELRGETMDSRKARAIYEEIVRSKRDPALIELAGHGLLRARVFPIANGETRKITLRYTQMLERAGDALHFRYAAGMPNSQSRSRDHDHAPSAFTLSIDDASGFGDPFSPTHEVRVQRSGRRVSVRPDGELRGDFDVFLPLLRAGVGMTLITHRPSSEPGFFMLTLSPGKVVETRVPRDVTVVVDVSGSMSGEKMEQARSAMRALLESLGAEDRFRMIAFSDQVRAYRREFTVASTSAQAAAADWIDELRAEGGTNISGALNEAFSAASPDSRLPFVIFITDGLPSVGEQNPERIAARAEQNRGRARVFAFGVGYDVNTYLLDRLSAAAKGATQYVRPGESVERPLGALAAKIRFPVLTDLRIGDAPVRIEEIYPVELPDLFADEELVIVGRYRGAGSGTLTVNGRRAARSELFSTNGNFADHELRNDYIPKIWAARKVGYLTQRLKLRGHDAETLEQLKETALRYGILTEYTSYLVQEPAERDMAANRLRPEQGRAMGSSPPTMQSGRAAVVAAESESRMRATKTAAAVDELADAGAAQPANTRTIAGRTFRLNGNVWTDTRYKSGGRMVSIEPFSAAYFALLRALPELEPYWKAFTNGTVAGARLSITLAGNGQKTLDAARVEAIAKEFRN